MDDGNAVRWLPYDAVADVCLGDRAAAVQLAGQKQGPRMNGTDRTTRVYGPSSFFHAVGKASADGVQHEALKCQVSTLHDLAEQVEAIASTALRRAAALETKMAALWARAAETSASASAARERVGALNRQVRGLRTASTKARSGSGGTRSGA